MRRWAKRLVLVSFLMAGLYAVLYLLPANVFLGTPLGPRLLNRNPQRLHVEWTSAWSLWPGEVEVHGLRLAGDTTRVRWAVSIDHGHGHVDLPALLRRRFQVRGFEGTGIVTRVDRHPPVPRTRTRRREPWTLQVEAAKVGGVRDLEYGPLRLTGDGRAAGSFSAVIGRQVRVDLERLEMTGGQLYLQGQPVARGLSLRAGLRLGPYAPRRHPGAAGFDFLSGTLLAAGPGRLAADVRVERGMLVPGSRLEMDPISTKATGGAPVAATVAVVRTPAGPRLRVEADLAGFTLPRRGGGPPVLTSEALRADALTPELRLSRLIGQARDLRRGQVPAGWTLPAEVRARGLRLTFPGRRASLEITAREARGRIDLPALLRREVLLEGVTGTRTHLRVTPAAATPRPARTPSRRPPWTVRSVRTRIDGDCDAELGTLHLQGALSAAGDLAWKDGLITLDLGSVRLSDAGLLQEEEPLARQVDLAGTLHFGPYAPRRPGVDWLDALSATLQGDAALPGVPALQRLSGSPTPQARLALDLRLRRGALRPGTRADLTQPPLTLTATVPDAGTALAVHADLPSLTLRRRTGAPFLTAEALRATTEIPHLRLSRLLDLVRPQGGGGEGGRPPGAGDWQRGRGSGRSAHEGAEHGRPDPLAGWGLSPADIDARSLRLTIPGARSSLELTADAGRGRLDLPALFQREARFTTLSLTGGDLRLLPGTGEPPPRPIVLPGDPPLWKADLADAHLTGGCQVDLGGFGFTSSLQAAGDLTWSGESLTIERVAAELAGGRLRSEGETVAQDMSLVADARLAPFDPARVEGLGAFRLVSGHWRLGGAVASLGFLRPYLEKASWLELDGSGSLDADLRVERGRLLPGSRLSVRPALLRAEYLLSRATGVADLNARVEQGPEGERLHVTADFDRFDIGARDGPEEGPAHVTGRGLRLSLVTRDLDLARGAKDLRVRLDLPGADVADLTFYNGYLPPGAGVEILSGSGRLRSWLEMETAGQTGRGEVALQSDSLRVRLYDLELAGALSLTAPLASPDLKALRFGLDGTRLHLERVAVREIGPRGRRSRATPPGWWARLELSQAEMDWGRPLSLAGSVDLAMRDSEVLLSLFSRRKPYLRWFRRALHIEDLAARGDLRLDQGAVVLDRLVATGRGLEARSRLRLSKDNPRGYLFLRRGFFRVGVELRDGRRHYRFRHPARWFESRNAP